ncbi:RNA 2',3'-cyclic phosphodiesterase [Candidatus Bathyarchaeota archaeon]|nr:RNA 2',3'-cyclic phosphodiesterase [Candidatus Bathyarchaeota archaeon]
MDRIRCFISFDVEDETILDRMVEAQRILLAGCRGLKIVKRENIHITLRFLGEIPSTTVDSVVDVMDKVRFTPFTVKILGVGAFPNLRRPSVVWAGITEGVDELKDIFRQIESGLIEIGFKPEPKGFSPHITLARVRRGFNRGAVAPKVLELRDFEFGEFRAETLRLKKSVLTPRGPIYSTIHEVKAK